MPKNGLFLILGNSPAPLWLRVLAFGLVYFLCAIGGNSLAPPGANNVVSFWFPAGLALVTLLLNRRGEWIWYVVAGGVANLAFDLWLGTALRVAGVFILANAVQAVVGAWLVQTLVTRTPTLGTLKELFGFLAVAGMAVLGSAALQAGILAQFGLTESISQAGRGWWGTCSLAILMFGPFLLVWAQPAAADEPHRPNPPRRWIEGIGLFGGLIVSTWVIFVMAEGVTTPFKFRTLPFLLWAGLRFGRRGAVVANLLYAIIVSYSTGHSQFTSALESTEVMFTVQSFLVVAALVGLVPAVALAERDATTEQLRQSEARYRNLTAAAFDGVVVSENGWIRDVSDQMAAMVGYARDEVVGKRLIDFVAPESRQAVLNAVRAESEAPYSLLLVRKDGTLFNAEARAKLVAVGGRTLRMAALRDVTNRLKAERALQQSETKYRTLFDAANDAIILMNRGEALDCNRKTEEMFRCTRAEILGRTPLDFAPEKQADEVLSSQRMEQKIELALSGQPQFFEWLHRRRDGTTFNAEVSLNRIELDGRPFLQAMVRDVTARRKAEEALRENQRRLATLMANLPGLVYRCKNDTHWTMEFVSDGCLALTGFRPDELLDNRVISFGAMIHPDDRKLVNATVQAAVQRRAVYEINYRIRIANGAEKSVWERGRGVFSNTDELVALEGFISDVTAQRKAEAEREAATRREQEARAGFTRKLIASQEAERTRIAREIHDHLGQLLTALKLDLHLLARRTGKVAEAGARQALEAKIISAEQLADETITSVQKIASELRPGILDRLGLAAAIEADAKTFESRTGVRCHCTCIVPPVGAEIPADHATATFRIFQEILTNIARHAHATEVKIALTVTPAQLELTAADNGVGLAPEHLADLKSLGLRGMRERAEILGGEIQFAPPPGGQGMQVTVRLPLGEVPGRNARG